MKTIIAKLDLNDTIEQFESFLSRTKPLFIQGDNHIHFQFLQELDRIVFVAPPKVTPLEKEFAHLVRLGVLHEEQIFEIVKIIRYFEYLKTLPFVDRMRGWLDEIIIPAPMKELNGSFDEKGKIKNSVDERLEGIASSLESIKQQQRTAMAKVLHDSRLAPYLVDRQSHLVDGVETALVRGGFNHVLKGRVVGRTNAGFFYVMPSVVSSLVEQEEQMKSVREDIIYEYCKKFSVTLGKALPFLKFINTAFDRFDHYQARVLFAKSKDTVFIRPKDDKKVILKDFCHPALSKPKPLSVDFSRRVLMVTGVNAGGKTMLLKSILSAVFLSKYLLPMRCDPAKTHIGTFASIGAVLDDPQNVKNDISTFAGRMKEFSTLLQQRDAIVGVDEIELGTDSDEAASLFKVILETMIAKECRVIVTTHHKRLAALMAGRNDVELLAALYDEVNALPRYEFLAGSIGRSYAFETATRYGIPHDVVKQAKIVYGEDKERLNDLIERSSQLELALQEKLSTLEEEIEKTKKLKESLKEEKEQQEESFLSLKSSFSKEYTTLLSDAREAIKNAQPEQIHRAMGEAGRHVKSLQATQSEAAPRTFGVGDTVGYGKSVGKILSISGKVATVDVDGVKMRLDMKLLKGAKHLAHTTRKAKTQKINLSRPANAGMTLDLHGLRSDEAIEKLDKFISDAILSGFEELLVYHGIGSGKLAHAVNEYLKTHPSIIEFSDAPANMGGYGAKIIHV